MAIKPIDAGVEFVREPRSVQALARRSSRPLAAAPEARPGGVGSEAEKTKTEQRKQLEDENRPVEQGGPSLRFHVDQESGKTVAELLDHKGQVLRQMPTEEALEVAKAIGKYQGTLVNLKV